VVRTGHMPDSEQWAVVRKARSNCSFLNCAPRRVNFGKNASQTAYGMGRSLMIIQDVPNLSRSMAKRKAKKVSPWP